MHTTLVTSIADNIDDINDKQTQGHVLLSPGSLQRYHGSKRAGMAALNRKQQNVLQRRSCLAE